LALLSARAGLPNPALVCGIVGKLPGNPARAILRSYSFTPPNSPVCPRHSHNSH
jgi:hypothetical protein